MVVLGSTIFTLEISFWDRSIQWDALHYLDIRNEGYLFDGCNDPRTAFFPLFPFIWKFLPSGGLTISIFNFTLFSISVIALTNVFQIRKNIAFLYLALPSCFFFLVPYTEAIQFAGLTLLLIGLKRNQLLYIFFGTFIATLSRPTATILVPAVFIVAFILIWQQQYTLKFIFIRLLLPMLLAIALGLSIVNGIQYYDTGVWWAMIKAQTCWDHGIHAFSFPILSWSEDYIHRYDGMMMDLILVIATGIIIWFIQLLLGKKSNRHSPIDIPFLFSSLYIAGVGFSILLFQKDTHSINRYLQCTPFFFVFLATLLVEIKRYNIKYLISIFLLLLFFSAPFGAFNHIQTLLWYLLSITIILLLLTTFYWTISTLQKISFVITYLVLTAFQAFLLLTFLNGSWVG
ncbi:MAG TPA: hypothetical protein VK750_09120 [Cytophagaceae bacterium]|nr:hypothetical protein [Cytophagaceae bacterium]